ncbi:MAG TPA: GDYXXLXY domain-containing protein [Bryobacteraceae bacterium]|nr:GDYXXLXY domain-containing protein [Bryobacteraceae bacterium]
MISRILLVCGVVLVFGVVNWQIEANERLRTSGQDVLLQIVPVDPRSLMQGDYMALNFDVARQIGAAVHPEERGYRVAVLALDEHRVGHFVRFDTGAPLNPGEVRFRVRLRDSSVWLGTNAFFFQEGDAGRYAGARYGLFRVNEDGRALLVDLEKQPPTGRAPE